MSTQNSAEEVVVTLPAAIHAEIIAHSREGKPEEICGVLRGRGLEAFELIRARNVAPERIENYDVDPQTLLRQFEFEEAGDEMMGIYHSHPVSVAYPSATDAWSAHYPDAIYFICSLEFDDAPVIRAFRMLTHFLDNDAGAKLLALSEEVDFHEPRRNTNIFARFQGQDAPVPEPLAAIADALSAPYYALYQVESASDKAPSDARIVTIVEHLVLIKR